MSLTQLGDHPTWARPKDGRNWSQQKGVVQQALSMSKNDRQDPQRWESDGYYSQEPERCRFHCPGKKDQYRAWVAFFYSISPISNDKQLIGSNTELSRGRRDQEKVWGDTQRESVHISHDCFAGDRTRWKARKGDAKVDISRITRICDIVIEYRS